MGWLTNSVKKYLTQRQVESYDECLNRLRQAGAQPFGTTTERTEQLEEDLARAVLMIHTLIEACVRKGVFTREEVAAVAHEIDLFDGIADGKLDPTVVRPSPPPPPEGPEAAATRWT